MRSIPHGSDRDQCLLDRKIERPSPNVLRESHIVCVRDGDEGSIQVTVALERGELENCMRRAGMGRQVV